MVDKICLYTRPFPEVDSYYKMINLAASYGMTALEGFSQFELAEPDCEAAKKLRAYADEKGIHFCCFSTYINLVGEDAAEQMERLKGYAKVAAALGSPYLHHTVINEIMNPQKVLPRKEELFRRGLAAVREIFDYAKPLGVRCIIEEQGYIYNGVENFSRFLREVDREVGVVADFGNLCMVEETLADFIEAFSDRICHVHVKDCVIRAERKGAGFPTSKGNYMIGVFPGEGCVGVEAAINLLKQRGYRGFYAMEYSVGNDASSLIKQAIGRVADYLKQ